MIRLRAGQRLGASLVVATLLACAPRSDSDGTATFDSVFTLVRTVELEETAADPIVSLAHVGRRPGGGFILADERSHRVRLFDASGRLDRVLGRPGDGPGELDGPTGSVELTDSRVLVVQRADPKITMFIAEDSTTTGRLPGQYGVWAERLGDRIVAGLGSRTDRFAIVAASGDALVTFGRVDPSVVENPFWIFFASENAAVVGDEIAINTSFFPRIRFFDSAGDSVRTIGVPPPSWIEPTLPPVDGMSEPGAREQIEEWSRSFTVVSAIAAVEDSLLVVQYGRHAPVDGDPYRVLPYAFDVYARSGDKLAEDIPLTYPIIGGGEHLLVLVSEPPAPWAIELYDW